MQSKKDPVPPRGSYPLSRFYLCLMAFYFPPYGVFGIWLGWRNVLRLVPDRYRSEGIEVNCFITRCIPYFSYVYMVEFAVINIHF